MCMCGATQARTGELVVVQEQPIEVGQLPKLRGNGACVREKSQFVYMHVLLHRHAPASWFS